MDVGEHSTYFYHLIDLEGFEWKLFHDPKVDYLQILHLIRLVAGATETSTCQSSTIEITTQSNDILQEN
jgi:hypothetical protein